MRYPLVLVCALALLVQAPGAIAQSPQLPPDLNGRVRVGGDAALPHKTKHVDLVFPASTRASDLSRNVIVQFVIGVKGKVTEAHALQPAPPFDAAAIAAVKQWEYEPTIFQGKAVPVEMTATVEFKSPSDGVAMLQVEERVKNGAMIVVEGGRLVPENRVYFSSQR